MGRAPPAKAESPTRRTATDPDAIARPATESVRRPRISPSGGRAFADGVPCPRAAVAAHSANDDSSSDRVITKAFWVKGTGKTIRLFARFAIDTIRNEPWHGFPRPDSWMGGGRSGYQARKVTDSDETSRAGAASPVLNELHSI